jgi:hypothetical protein
MRDGGGRRHRFGQEESRCERQATRSQLVRLESAQAACENASCRACDSADSRTLRYRVSSKAGSRIRAVKKQAVIRPRLQSSSAISAAARAAPSVSTGR